MLTFNEFYNKKIFLEAEAAIQFEPLADSLGIPRHEMPQIKSDFVRKYFSFLQKKGIQMMKTLISPLKLKGTQDKIDLNKVNKYIKDPCSTGLFGKRILISNDFYVLDGHHHWMAMKNGFPNRMMKVYMINAPIQTLLSITQNFKKAKYQGFKTK